jgi:hypothetical protein
MTSIGKERRRERGEEGRGERKGG